MERRSFAAYVILIVLLGATALALALFGEKGPMSSASIRTRLPETIGPWTGTPVLYCRDDACDASAPVVEDLARPVCKSCGAALSAMSRGEKRLLPADTRIARRSYVSTDGRRILASVVLMGSDRTSIHRPQMCLEGQGYRIVTQRFVPLPEAGPGLPAMAVLDLVHAIAGPEGVAQQRHFVYAYWYAGGGRNTASHLRMQGWMAFDRLFRSRADRWAYVSLFASANGNADARVAEIQQFATRFWPMISGSP